LVKNWQSIFINWDEVINNYFFDFSIDSERNFIDAFWIELLATEDLRNNIRPLGRGG
jgi:hypothetical protein